MKKITKLLSVLVVIVTAGIVGIFVIPNFFIQSPILSKMDISDADYLFIAPGSARKLFKIVDSSSIEEVTYEDENGNPMIMTREPIAIYNVNDNFLIICFGPDDLNIEEGYLVRKSDGAVFSLANAGYPLVQDNYFINDKTVYNDSNGNIYYRAKLQESGYSGALLAELVKLNTENPNKITKTTYSPTEEHVEVFIIDKDGNAPYYGRLKTEPSGTQTIYRIRKGNGGFYTLPSGTMDFWLGLDGVSYFLNASGLIQKISINSTYDVELSEYGSSYGPFSFNTYESYRLELKDRIIIIDTNQGKLYEVYNPSEQPREIILAGSPISTIRRAVASDNYYYLSGTNDENKAVLIQVNATDDSWTSLYPADTYDIYTMSVSSSDMLLFNALRLSDGIKVIGEINATASPPGISILDETSNTQMTVLRRIA